jgi:GAF domain-containing protein
MHDPVLASYRRSQAAKLYGRAVEIHESSAHRLRATGREAAADRVERLAAMARDRIDHPAAMARMYSLAQGVRKASRLGEVLDGALDGAITFLAADFGSIQLLDPHTRTLRIVSQRGFTDDFLHYFAVVEDQQAACGRAAAARTQAVIADVDADPAFAAHRAIAAASGFRAVQSTPLIDQAGCLRGVLSTHFQRPHHPAAHELRLTETYAQLVADAIARIAGRA